MQLRAVKSYTQNFPSFGTTGFIVQDPQEPSGESLGAGCPAHSGQDQSHRASSNAG